MIENPQLSLLDGAISLWPTANVELAEEMMVSLGKRTGIPVDIPFAELDARHRRTVFYGTGDRWIDVTDQKGKVKFSFQYKGLYPTLEEASRLLPSLRLKLQSFVGDVECGSCLLYTSPSPRDQRGSRMPSSA